MEAVTGRVDPRKDLLGALEYLIEQQERIAAELAEFTSTYALRTVTIDELAEMHGCTAQTMRNCPWKLPRYGRADIGQAPRRWLMSTVRSWYARPEDERRAEWDAMSARERRAVLGRVG